MTKPIFYECEICGSCHYWDWDGDCRQDGAQFTEKWLDAVHGVNGYELRSMEERVEAND